jgi:hypothetical protein
MTGRRRFSPSVLAALDKGKILGIRAGRGEHRFIGVWMVVVNGRLFVRSYTLKPDGWYHTFLEEPRGVIQVGAREIRVRAVRTRSERVKNAVDRAYAVKYNTPGALKYVRGFRNKKRKDTTTELMPL